MLKCLQDDQERLAFLQSVVKKVDKENSQDALVFVSVAVARVKLNLNELEDARKDLDAAERILDSFDSVETIVHAAFYDANASYYQAWPDPTPPPLSFLSSAGVGLTRQ